MVRQFIALLAVHFAIMPAGDSAVHPRPVHRHMRPRQQVHAHELWLGVQVEHKHREAVVQVVVLVHINHQLCPGQALLACHVQPQAGVHLAQLRLVRLLKQLPDELAGSVEAALAEVVHLLRILLLETLSKVAKVVREKCHLVSRKKLFHPIKGILAAGLEMKIV